MSYHEEPDGLNLGQMTVLMLLLCVAVCPVVQTEPYCYVTSTATMNTEK